MCKKLKRDIVFVVLNYNVYKETCDCVNSIKLNIDTNKYHIVIVDNNSSNSVGMSLAENYADDDRVTVILNDENVGFAKGNNIGIDYSRKIFEVKYVCCLNNDTLLEKQDFYKCVEECYLNEKPAVIGPKIILKNGDVQGLVGSLKPISEYQAQLKSYMERNSFKKKIKRFLLRVKSIRQINAWRHRIIAKFLGKDANSVHKNVILHGCCLVFTPTFFEIALGFDDRTFMYREEELLYVMLKKHGLNNIYYPYLEIRHLEDVSTDSVFFAESERENFLCDNQIKSLRILVKELSDSDNKLY